MHRELHKGSYSSGNVCLMTRTLLVLQNPFRNPSPIPSLLLSDLTGEIRDHRNFQQLGILNQEPVELFWMEWSLHLPVSSLPKL